MAFLALYLDSQEKKMTLTSNKDNRLDFTQRLPYSFWLTVGGYGRPPKWQAFQRMAKARVERERAETALEEARKEARRQHEAQWSDAGVYGHLKQRNNSKELRKWHKGYILADRESQARDEGRDDRVADHDSVNDGGNSRATGGDDQGGEA